MNEKQQHLVAGLKRPDSREVAAFSVIELVVAMAIMVEVLIVVLILFDVNQSVTRVQTQVADLQQNQRISQYEISRMVRMAGRGGLPRRLAVDIGAAGVNHDIVNDANSPVAMENTDIITIRGVFSDPVWHINARDPASYTPSTAGVPGEITIVSVSPDGISQETTPLEELDAAGAGSGEALLMVSQADDLIWGVAAIDRVTCTSAGDINGDGTDDTSCRVEFADAADARSVAYSGAFTGQDDHACSDPASPNCRFTHPVWSTVTRVGWAGILEEYRYYIREEFIVPGDNTSGLRPRLSRARVYPNTDEVWNGEIENARVDISDNVIDLQAALAIDLDLDGAINPPPTPPVVSPPPPLPAPEVDEWIMNAADTNLVDSDGNDVPDWAERTAHYLRFTLLTRTERPERGYTDRALQSIEDHIYNEPTAPTNPAQVLERAHRRRQATTTVEFRNL